MQGVLEGEGVNLEAELDGEFHERAVLLWLFRCCCGGLIGHDAWDVLVRM